MDDCRLTIECFHRQVALHLHRVSLAVNSLRNLNRQSKIDN